MPDEEQSLDPEVFIPEAYCTHKEILTSVEGYGWGLRLPHKELSKAILEKRVAAKIIIDRAFVVIVHETAVPKE